MKMLTVASIILAAMIKTAVAQERQVIQVIHMPDHALATFTQFDQFGAVRICRFAKSTTEGTPKFVCTNWADPEPWPASQQ